MFSQVSSGTEKDAACISIHRQRTKHGSDRGIKGGNSRVTVEPPLIVYKEPGVYTENILKIYDMI